MKKKNTLSDVFLAGRNSLWQSLLSTFTDLIATFAATNDIISQAILL